MQNTKMKITYATIAAALGLALSSSFITGALAANPHFIGQPNCTVSTSTHALSCSGSVAGLGNVSGAQLSATFQGTYSCTATGQPITGQEAPVSSSNGRTNFAGVTINPPPSGSITCTPTLTSATYTNVVITFSPGGQSLPISGTFTG